jgi:3-oxo-4-pregnene-20-carboxyl-CoA dehydrogenase alpha subunit
VPTGMEFTPGETQQAAARLTAEVLGQARPPGRAAGARAHESAVLAESAAAIPPGQNAAVTPAYGAAVAPPYDAALWKELGRAGLLSLALPAWMGGDELGVLDVAAVLTEVGRQAAAVPALATLALGVLPVARWGDRGVQRALLDGVASGDVVLTAAVREPSEVMPTAPATAVSLPSGSAAGTGPGTVSGVKVGVPYGAAADWILVPASIAGDGAGTAVVAVAKSASGLSWQRTHSATGAPEYTLRLDGAPVSHVLGAGTATRAVADLYQLATAGACCLADGAVARALALTKAHLASREQFGRPLATFQAAAGKIADVYITARTLHLATLSACWRLDTGRAAAADLDVAAYWLADQAPAALRTCHHLHGGIGMDASYPLHRYSSLVKDLARFVGGAEHRLDRLAARACGQAGGSGGTVRPGRLAGGSGGAVPPGRLAGGSGGVVPPGQH